MESDTRTVPENNSIVFEQYRIHTHIIALHISSFDITWVYRFKTTGFEKLMQNEDFNVRTKADKAE